LDIIAIGRSPFYFNLIPSVGSKADVTREWQLKSVKIFDEDEQVTRSEWCHEVTIYDLAQRDQFGSEGIVLNAVVSRESELYPDSEQRYRPGAWEEHVIGVARNAADILKARFGTE
jgi:PhoPQ-activated pathogenicity-related protein